MGKRRLLPAQKQPEVRFAGVVGELSAADRNVPDGNGQQQGNGKTATMSRSWAKSKVVQGAALLKDATAASSAESAPDGARVEGNAAEFIYFVVTK